MPAGRPRKRPRNLTGLRNQKPQDVPVPVAQPTPIDQSAGLKKAPNDSQGADVQDEPKEPDAELLGKTMGQKEVEGEEKPEADNDNEEVAVLDDWNDEELHENMIRLAANEGNNPQDEDWVPYELQKSKKRTRTGEEKQQCPCNRKY